MLLSIIIPMYNAEPYINQCLDSILCQGLSPDNYEVIIVNDGSTDKSEKIVQAYLSRCGNFKLFNQENKGQSAARNLGIAMARGDYIQFVDADDFLISDSMHQVVNYAQGETDKNVNDMIIFDILGGIPDTVDNVNNKTGECKWQGNGYDYIATHNYNNSPCYYWLRRSFVSRIDLKFIAGKLCEDGMFTLTALLNAHSVVHLDTSVYFYAIRPNSTTTSMNSERRKKIVEGFIYAISYFDKMIEIHRGGMQRAAVKRVIARRDSYVFFLLIRLLKMGAYHEAKTVIELYKRQGLYPIQNFLSADYSGLKLRLITRLINITPLYLLLCGVKRILSK